MNKDEVRTILEKWKKAGVEMSSGRVYTVAVAPDAKADRTKPFASLSVVFATAFLTFTVPASEKILT